MKNTTNDDDDDEQAFGGQRISSAPFAGHTGEQKALATKRQMCEEKSTKCEITHTQLCRALVENERGQCEICSSKKHNNEKKKMK